jgi:hypothetical protein
MNAAKYRLSIYGGQARWSPAAHPAIKIGPEFTANRKEIGERHVFLARPPLSDQISTFLSGENRAHLEEKSSSSQRLSARVSIAWRYRDDDWPTRSEVNIMTLPAFTTTNASAETFVGERLAPGSRVASSVGRMVRGAIVGVSETIAFFATYRAALKRLEAGKGDLFDQPVLWAEIRSAAWGEARAAAEGRHAQTNGASP